MVEQALNGIGVAPAGGEMQAGSTEPVQGVDGVRIVMQQRIKVFAYGRGQDRGRR